MENKKDENKKTEPELPGMTPEQKEKEKQKSEKIAVTVGKLNKMLSPFIFNQLHMIESGDIHIHLIVNEFDVSTIELHSRLARDLTVRTVRKVEERSEKEPEGAKES